MIVASWMIGFGVYVLATLDMMSELIAIRSIGLMALNAVALHAVLD